MNPDVVVPEPVVGETMGNDVKAPTPDAMSSNQSDSDPDYEPSDGETLGSDDTEVTEYDSDDDYETDDGSDLDDFIVDDDEDLEEDDEGSDVDEEDDDGEEEGTDDDMEDAAIIVLPSIRALGRSYRGGGGGLALAMEAFNNESQEESENCEACAAEGTEGRGRGAKRPRSAYTREERAYLAQLPEAERERIEALVETVAVTNKSEAIPLRFRILASPMSPAAKSHLISRLTQLQRMNEGSGEYHKLNNWLHNAVRLPLGVYRPLSIARAEGAGGAGPNVDAIRAFLQNTRATLDATIYGHKESKDQILRILAQWVSNPASRGHCIGIQGPMGTGKTSLVKNGIAKALDMPFAFIALGGASDGAFLEGHGFTYEGSTYGKLAEALMKMQCMNGLIFLDELDKLSDTSKGEEVSSLLTHLTDSSQNSHITDRYFGELELDFSKALMVFSYNDESRINNILKDRMVTVRVSGYTTEDKLVIAANHLLPSINEQYGLSAGDVVFDPDVVRAVIGRVGEEDGVRNLRRGLEAIVGWLNMLRYVPEPGAEPIAFPVHVDDAMVRRFLKKDRTMNEDLARTMYV
jgi:ATP-dependent Lon protease